MNYKNLLIIIVGLIIVSTLCILISKPKMHKVVMIYNSDYVAEVSETVEIEEKTIPTIVQTPETTTTKVKSETVVEKKATPAVKTASVKEVQKATTAPTVQKEVKKTTKPKVEQQQTVKVQPRQEVKVAEAPVVKQVQTVQQKPVQTVQRPVQQHVQQTIQQKPTQAQTPQKVLTAQEEEIAWNIWRSNLQNQIMKDVRLPIIPNGIIFKFSFDVDKFGKVSNVQTWSTTPSYTPYAVQFVAPVIRSYQGKRILNFPVGSARTTTHVTGGWRIASSTKYSTPNDYNDTEKVVR